MGPRRARVARAVCLLIARLRSVGVGGTPLTHVGRGTNRRGILTSYTVGARSISCRTLVLARDALEAHSTMGAR